MTLLTKAQAEFRRKYLTCKRCGSQEIKTMKNGTRVCWHCRFEMKPVREVKEENQEEAK